jgi:hypothetical protein
MKVNDLTNGEQVVTTVKRENIPKDKPKPPTPWWLYVLITYFVLFFIWALREDFSLYGSYPPKHYPPIHPPEKPYPSPDPYSPCPIPKTPECPW